MTILVNNGVMISDAASYGDELWLLAGRNLALLRGARYELSEDTDLSPYTTDTGTMYLPVSIICAFTGDSYTYSEGDLTITTDENDICKLSYGSIEWTRNGSEQISLLLPVEEKNGEPFITILSARDIFGVYNYYDSRMGLLILGEAEVSGYNTSLSSVKSQMNTLYIMIMDRPSGDKIYTDLVNGAGVSTHPRLIATEDDFDRVRSAYFGTGTDDEFFRNGINGFVNTARWVFDTYFEVIDGKTVWKEGAKLKYRHPHYIYDENGNRLVGATEYTYFDEALGEDVTLTLDSGSSRYGDGYDVGGRLSTEELTYNLVYIAFMWQLTGEEMYKDAYYLMATALGEWEHWGEGHFLNCADASANFSIALDWMYHAFDNEPEKRAELYTILYNKGLLKGYYSLKYNNSSWILSYYAPEMCLSKTVSGGWRTADRTNNWQAVCGSGMTLSALMLMEIPEYLDRAKYVAEQYTRNLEKCLYQYVPDGSYPESPVYWNYCTNTLMETLASFKNSCMTAYGITDTVGLYESFYYAIGISNSDYKMWGYHDSGAEELDFQYFHLASRLFGDDTLAAYRKNMLEELGRSMSLNDILNYYDVSSETDGIALDNNFKGIYTATMRSSWNSGAIYTGLHVGPNIHDHSDFDSGSFILSMDGIDWCIDPGTEDYNVSGFFDNSNGGNRHRLYRKSLEGHSAVVIRSDELYYGGLYTTYSSDFPVIDSFHSEDDGAYAVSNMKKQYGSNTLSAYRGVLLTNSRRTVVLQDEISFSSPTSLTWLLNLKGNIEIAPDGRSLVSTIWVDGNTAKRLRVTMLSDDTNLKFRVLGKNETVLSTTITRQNSGDPLCADTEQRVVIEADGVTDFNVACVFESLGHKDEVVGYEMVPMSDWSISDDKWLDDANSGIIYPGSVTYKYSASDFARAIAAHDKAESWAERYKIFRETEIYLTDYNKNDASVKKQADRYISLMNRCNYEIDKINSQFANIFTYAIPSGSPFSRDP